MIPATEMLDGNNKIQYLDLDLPTTNSNNTHSLMEEEHQLLQQQPMDTQNK